MVDNTRVRQFFRFLALLNLVVLLLSVPFSTVHCAGGNDTSDGDNSPSNLVQLCVITGLDAVLALLFTVQFALRLRYFVAMRRPLKNCLYVDNQQRHFARHWGYIRLCNVFCVTFSLWWSVGVGIYEIVAGLCERQHFYLHWVAILRTLSIFSALKFFVVLCNTDLPSLSAWKNLFTLDVPGGSRKVCKQLVMVTIFYFIFVFLFALVGVHWIGGLNKVCLYNVTEPDGNVTTLPAIPIIHCNPEKNRSLCGAINDTDTPFFCGGYPFDIFEEASPQKFLSYRTRVYYGQFRVILDALFAVYEASTLELWSFMFYTAVDGQDFVQASIFFVFLVIFIVILLQQSIFLVVIIESFADLRGESGKMVDTQKKQLTKPTTVLLTHAGTDRLRLEAKDGYRVTNFKEKYYGKILRIEKAFLFLVLLDAIFTSFKFSNMPEWAAMTLLGWQIFVSIVFVAEYVSLMLFHLYHRQHRLFFTSRYNWALFALALGGAINCAFYNPLKPSNGFIIFQSLRMPRLLRLNKDIKNFFNKTLGHVSIPTLIIVSLIIVLLLSVVNAQIFGYIPVAPECQRLESSHFSTISDAILSTFQLVMNEAWTDVTSEEMCHRDYSWPVINLYFIVMHIFFSLIFLNFFGAIILDNLEYSEEEKKKKLEELEKPKQKQVPKHLQIFKHNRPKRVKPPTGIENSNLEEVELQRFYESGNQATDEANLQEFVPGHQVQAPIFLQRRSSELQQLSLVSTDSSELIVSDTPALQGKYNSITAILSYVKQWRERSARETTQKSGGFANTHYLLGGQGITDQIGSQKDEHLVWMKYDEFREKHRCFDMALFCMSREHRLRKFCTNLLSAQAKPPRSIAVETVSSNKTRALLQRAKRRISFIIQALLSTLPYVNWLMLVVVLISVGLQIYEYSYLHHSRSHYYITVSEILYLLVVFSWLLLKILSHGLFLNPEAAISSFWDVIDWVIILDSLAVLVLQPVWSDNSFGVVVMVDLHNLPLWAQILMVVRALRPLQIITVVPRLRQVISEVLEGWPHLLRGMVIMFGFMWMFSSLGLQLFAGTGEYNPQAYCNDPYINHKEDCVGEFLIKLTISPREFIDENNNSDIILVSRVWFEEARDYRFDTLYYSFCTLFQLLTLEGWLEVRDLFEGRNSDVAQKAVTYMYAFIQVYIFIAINLGLQLFVGIVVNNFNEHKAGHSFLLSVDQKRWAELMQRISLQRPYKLPQEPRNSRVRQWLYKKLTHPKYQLVPSVIIALSTAPLFVTWQPGLLELSVETVQSLIIASVILNQYSVLEFSLKMLAFGPTGYLKSWRNVFDLLMTIFSVGYFVLAVIVLAISFNSFHDHPVLINDLTHCALILTVMKCITVMVKYSAMLNLLLTVVVTIIRGIPLMMVLTVVVICYSLVGVVLFGGLRTGEAVDLNLVNFLGSVEAMSVMLRSLTGEDWYQIMWDAAVAPPYCEDRDCGEAWLSILYFFSFTMIVPFIFLNVFIGVLLENFSIFYNDDDTRLNRSTIKDFKHKWRLFNSDSDDYVPANRLKLFLRSLDMQDFYTYNIVKGTKEREMSELTEHPLILWEMEEELKREASVPNKNSFSPDSLQLEFQSVLKMLAYRCEDIHKRLEPHELYTREELETSIQIEVAETAIRNWLQMHVKPVLNKQRDEKLAEESQHQVTIIDKRQRLLNYKSMFSQMLISGFDKQHSMETDDEDTLPQRQSRIYPVVSEEQFENDVEPENTSLIARSFKRLEEGAATAASSGRDQQEKAREWLLLQQEWTERMDEDENYFDDQL